MAQRILPILAFLLALAFAASPFFSDSFGGFDAADFPVQAPWYAQPAGWAFSIWGLIYAALILGTGYGLTQREVPQWQSVCVPLCVSLLIGVPWVETAGRAPLVASLMMIGIWGGAVLALLRAGPQLWQRIPLGLYAGWLTAAMCVAFSASATGQGWLAPMASALLALGLALVLAVAILRRLPGPDWAFRLILVWAFVGVIAANYPIQNWPVLVLCAVAVVLALVLPTRGRG